MTTVRPAIDAAARAAIATRTEALFRASGAFREGHFLLKSGRHGDAYVEKFAVLSDPAATSELCGFWAAARPRPRRRAAWSTSSPGRRPAASSSPSRPAASSASASIFAEEVRDDDGTTRREFRRGFRIEPGERVLLVDDILTTGGSLLAMIPAVEAMGGEIVECAVLVDRSGGRTTLTSPTTGRVYPLRSLWQLDLPTYEPGPATCPRCADGTPAARARAAAGPAPDPVDRRTRNVVRGPPRDRHRRDRRRGADPRGRRRAAIAARPLTPTSRRASSSRSTRGR